MTGRKFSQGAEFGSSGVHYRVWAPKSERVAVRITAAAGATRTLPLAGETDGYHSVLDSDGVAGDRFAYELNGGGAFPCPASRFQPEDVSGPSMVIDPQTFSWTDQEWLRPAFRELVIYELHVGTFTPDGTYRAAMERLPYLRELGVNALEVMPLADFPGEYNWGYDGVRLYAPARVYGQPDDLRALVDAAHGHGLAVILDVVYNHFGPDGNFLKQFSPDYFEGRHHTPWGEAINFSRSPQVRAYYEDNILYWMDEFHIDGFRLDATHTIFDDSPRHILAELAEIAHARGGYIIAEDEQNLAKVIESPAEGGIGMNAVWADDFHHTVDVALIEGSMYTGTFEGKLHELVNTLKNGWVHPPPWPAGGPRMNTACAHLPPEKFVFCISNHDQSGNRAFGERINHFISAETYRAASALLCLVPYTPLIFMGQEWGASTPFLYFTDHHDELGHLVAEGRRRDLRKFPIFERELAERDFPSPQARETFEQSKLQWEEAGQAGHGACLRLYRAALRLRREHGVFRPHDRARTKVAELSCEVLAIRARSETEEWLLLCDLRGGHRGDLRAESFCALPAGRQWHPVFSSNAPEFGGPEPGGYDPVSGHIVFQHPEVLVLRAE
ncbi:MAG: malto-oligosyltrehalose trehalohydrolase [Chthoniobacter sp.]|uniref:malto-oligosyltrehalose trehalohydrolase n=1 Tax=Chthoniobacter sp. TaxID=2510640 RepID=UPI0032A44878